MRLSRKVSLISIAVLLLVVVVIGAVLLSYAKSQIIEHTIEKAKAEHRNLNTSFAEMTAYYLADEDSPAVQRTLVIYCFSRFATDTSVLIQGEETLYTRTALDSAQLLPLQIGEEQKVFSGEVEGRNILLVGQIVSLNDSYYSVYRVEDITYIYNNIQQMIVRFILIGIAGLFIGTLLILLLVHRLTKPLLMLKEASAQIARGDYNIRADIHTRDEVGELAQDFNAMADAVQSHIDKLTDMNERQSLFISGLTHEYKTPMTSILLHSETLLTADLDKKSTENSLAHIHDQCRFLEQLTHKMLSLLVLEREITPQKISLPELLEDVSQNCFQNLMDHGTPLTIRCDADSVTGDYDLIKSLLINLIDNASKASEPGQHIHLRAYEKTIEVADNGVGIPEDSLPFVFDPFYMSDPSRSKKGGGSGLGLAIARRIAEAHGAKLLIESKPGQGTTVRLIMP